MKKILNFIIIVSISLNAIPFIPTDINAVITKTASQQSIVKMSENDKDEESNNQEYVQEKELTEEEVQQQKDMEPKLTPLANHNIELDDEYENENRYVLPSYYDSRNRGLITGVKNQNPYGMCWTFAAASAAETSMIKNGLANGNVDLSEKFISYFAFNHVSDLFGNTANDQTKMFNQSPTAYLNDGGSTYLSTLLMAQGQGPVSESSAPYNASPLNSSLANSKVARLSDTIYVSSTRRNRIKQLVSNYGSAILEFYYTNSSMNYNTGGYNYTGQFYYNNHEVVIVGWDDNYSRNNFISKPNQNGAWIVKNSFGSGWGDSGYMYISYEDKSFTPVNDGPIMATSYESPNQYKYIYQYDGTNIPLSYKVPNNTVFSNIYTVKGSSRESLDAVSFQTMSGSLNYEISIYKNLTSDNDPYSGIKVWDSNQKGSLADSGYHTIPLEQKVILNKGEKYSVCIKLQSIVSSTFNMGIEGNVSSYVDVAKSIPNLIPKTSFKIEENGTKMDLKNLQMSARIKALSNPVTKPAIALNKNKIRMDKTGDEKLEASIYNSSDSVIWKSSNKDIATVDADGNVVAKAAGMTTINATLKDGTSASCEVIVEDAKLTYSSHVENIGWIPESQNGEIAGTTGKFLELEALKIKIENSQVSGDVEYTSNIQDIGWQDWKKNNELSGTTGTSKQIEALKIRLKGELASQYDIYYRAHVQSHGWMDWAKNGQISGTIGYEKRIESIQIVLVEKGKSAPGATTRTNIVSPIEVAYQTHVSNHGWTGYKSNGVSSGVIGKGVEAFNVTVKNSLVSAGIRSKSKIVKGNWQNWVEDNQTSGTVGQKKHIEAFQMELTKELKNDYDLYYRVYVKSVGWLDWGTNGQIVGSSGYNYPIESIQVKLLKKGEAFTEKTDDHFVEPKISYQTHIQTIGWQGTKYDGELSGLTGQSKRLEAIRIKKENNVSGDIIYRTHIQRNGWQNWAKNGELSGSEGESLRLEAICINLTGELAQKYDVYYRVHVQNLGWLDWAKNGNKAGTSGYSLRLEGIQIKLVEKGDPAPGKTTNPYKFSKVSYQSHVQTLGWQSTVNDGNISGITGISKRLESVRIGISNEEYEGSISYTTHIQRIGWQDADGKWKKDNELSGTEGKSLRLEAIKIELIGEIEKYYDVYYRVHSQNFGWLGWAKNGEPSGTQGYSYRLEGLQIQLVRKGEAAPTPINNAFMLNQQ